MEAPAGRQVYGPAVPLRVAAGLAALVCIPGVATHGARLLRGDLASALGVAIWLLPVWFAAAVLLKRIAVDEAGIASRSIAGGRSCAWDEVLRVEVTRGGFVVVTQAGAISAGWLRPRDRESLLAAAIRDARLGPSGEAPPPGVRLLYVRQRPTIRLSDIGGRRAGASGETTTNGQT